MPGKKLGRPTNNPKSKPIHVRLDTECDSILEKYCNQEKVPKTEGIRRGIKKLESDIKSRSVAPLTMNTTLRTKGFPLINPIIS